MPAVKHLIADIPVKALIRSGEKILLVEEPDGQWALPGGRIHEGETPLEALRREVREELGVEIDVGTILESEIFTSKGGQHHFVVVFDATLSGADALPSLEAKEIKDMKWVEMGELDSVKLRPEYRRIFGRLG